VDAEMSCVWDCDQHLEEGLWECVPVVAGSPRLSHATQESDDYLFLRVNPQYMYCKTEVLTVRISPVHIAER